MPWARFCTPNVPLAWPVHLLLSTCSIIHPRDKSTLPLHTPPCPISFSPSVLFPYFLTSPGEPCIWCGIWAEGISLQNYQVDRGSTDQYKWSHLVFIKFLLHSWYRSLPSFSAYYTPRMAIHSDLADGETELQGIG